MASTPLPNYLRSHRKRLALSQEEIAFLLGAKGGPKVCRYERFARVPSLETAMAYEAIFRKPARELFAGLFQEIEKKVARRAKILVRKTVQNKPGTHTAKKCRVLAGIGSGSKETQRPK